MIEPMAQVLDGSFEVDAKLLAPLLGISPAEVPALLRAKKITSVVERGEGEHAGTYRLTFFHGACRARIILDEGGRIRRRSAVDFGERLPKHGRRVSR